MNSFSHFKSSRLLKMNSLLEKRVFKVAGNVEAFGLRVCESWYFHSIKYKGTLNAYKNLPMGVQGFNNMNNILTLDHDSAYILPTSYCNSSMQTAPIDYILGCYSSIFPNGRSFKTLYLHTCKFGIKSPGRCVFQIRAPSLRYCWSCNPLVQNLS